MSTLRRAGPADAADLTRLRGLMHLAMGDGPNPEWQARCEADLQRRLATDTFTAYVVEQADAVVSGGWGGWRSTCRRRTNSMAEEGTSPR